jgi:hypothetical protein
MPLIASLPSVKSLGEIAIPDGVDLPSERPRSSYRGALADLSGATGAEWSLF